MIPGCYCPPPRHVALPQVSCFPPHLLLPLTSLVFMLSGGSFGGQVSPNGLPFLQRVHNQNKTQFPDHLPMAGGQFGFGLDGAEGTNPGSGSTRCTVGKYIHSPVEKWNPGIGRTSSRLEPSLSSRPSAHMPASSSFTSLHFFPSSHSRPSSSSEAGCASTTSSVQQPDGPTPTVGSHVLE